VRSVWRPLLHVVLEPLRNSGGNDRDPVSARRSSWSPQNLEPRSTSLAGRDRQDGVTPARCVSADLVTRLGRIGTDVAQGFSPAKSELRFHVIPYLVYCQ